MTTPHNVIFREFGNRRSHQEAVREQRDCQLENPVHESLKKVAAWLKEGKDPLLERAQMANNARDAIMMATDDLSQSTTPEAAIAFMEKWTAQMKEKLRHG